MKRKRRKRRRLARGDWVQVPGYFGMSCMWPEEREAIGAAIPETGRALEIGSLHGVTVAIWAKARPQVEFWSVDPFINLKAGVGSRENWQKNRQPNMNLVIGTIDDLLPTNPGSFDFIFIDGDHNEESCYHDLIATHPLLAPSGQLVVHDYNQKSNPGVKPAVARFCRETGLAIQRTVRTTVWLT